MKKLIQFTTDDGSDFFVEVPEVSPVEAVRGGYVDESRGVVQNAAASFEKALAPLKEISNSIINCMKEVTNNPDEVSVELGLKFSAKAGIILTSVDSEANLKISLTWKKDK